MTNENKHEMGAHIRVYDENGLVAAFTVDFPAVNVAADIFAQYVGVKNE